MRARVRTWTDDDQSGAGGVERETARGERLEGKGTPSSGVDDDTRALWKRASGMCFRAFGGFWEGLALISKHKYVMRILAVSCFYEIVVTVLDYEFKMLGAGSLEPSHESDKNATDSFKFAHLMGYFGQITNLLSLFVSLLGFSFFVKNFGVRFSLMLFPSLLLIAVVIANLVPSLWVLFFIVSVLKATLYSFNEPVKELLYQPTSVAIKFKAKAWIDVFGSRLAKAGGSFISSHARGSVSRLQLVSEIPSFGVAITLLYFAWQVGSQFQYLIREGIVVGESEIEKEDENGDYARLKSVAVGDSKNPFDFSVRRGLKPGDVGYDGYDLHLFDGVFEDADDDEESDGGSGRDSFGPWRTSRRSPRVSDANRSVAAGRGGASRVRREGRQPKTSPRASSSVQVATFGNIDRPMEGMVDTSAASARVRSESADF